MCCGIYNGHARCEAWDLAAGIHGLQACTTRITFSLIADPQYVSITRFRDVDLLNIDFSRLTGLIELSISSNYGNYSHIRMVTSSSAIVTKIPNIKVLRLKATRNSESLTATNEGIYKHMKHLEVLDLTRAQRLGLSFASLAIGQEPSMKTLILILRNIQGIGHAETCNPFVDLTHFMCGGNVLSLDLSYNYITYVNISNGCWNTKIRYINLNHNILASSIQIRQRLIFDLAPMSAGFETFTASSINPGDKNQDGLWDNEYTIPEYHDRGDIKLSHLSRQFLHSPFNMFCKV